MKHIFQKIGNQGLAIQVRWAAVASWACALSLLLLAAEAQAASITVNTAVDEVNGNTGSVAALIGTPGGAGISLREAIIATNNTAGADVILFAAGLNGVPIILTRVGDDATAQNGDLDINDHLTITGNGAANTIIQGSTNATFAGSMGDKAFGINQDGFYLGLTVSISDLTIRWCRNSNPVSGTFSYTGGGVDVFLTGTGNSTAFTNCTITGNESVNGTGGGVNVDSGTVGAPGDVANNTTNRGTVTLTNCTVTNNKVVSSVEGAGINLYSDIHNVTLTNCSVTGNTGMGANSNGGGMNIRHTYGGTVTINNGTYSNNTTAGIGGGIYIGGSEHISMSSVTIDGNSSTNATAKGGGLTITPLGVAGFTANINISSTNISNNVATTGVGEGGGIYFNSPYSATLTNCIITGNSADIGAGVQNAGGTTGTIILAISGSSITNNVSLSAGGGLSHTGSVTTTTVTNCTITGNTTTGNGGGIYVAATDATGTVTLDGVTISSNTADFDNNGSGDGGGIYHSLGTLNLNNTITIGSSGNSNSAVNGGGIANVGGNLSKTSGLLTVANNIAKNHGGGLYITGGTINFQKANIISNTANSDNAGGGEGGGIYNNNGTLTLNFNRIALNTANANLASNALRHASGTITNIQNNWWGTNSPATVINGTASFTPYLQLTHTPASASICPNTSTGLTASFVNNSANTNVLANIDRLIGLSITFGTATPTGSSISSAQTTIQANGTATATFNSGTTSGAGGANATVDNFAVNAAITVYAPPNVTLDPVSQSICPGDPVTFTTAATGNPTPTVQWQVSTNGGMSFSNVGGATNTILTFNVVTADNSKQYQAVFTNTCNTDISSAATLTVYPVENPAFAYGKDAYCRLGTDPAPTIYGTTGGVFSAPAQVSINTNTGQIDVSASTTGGPYTITYNTNGPCPETATFAVSIVSCVPGATLTAALTIDNGTPAKADPGDRIKLTATLSNAQTADYEGVQLVPNNDPKVTLVPGSFKSTPVAVNDAYTATLNTLLTVTAGSGVLLNDFDDNIPGLNVTAFSAASAQGGTVSVSANGSFTYTPPNGFTGNDTFTYTITDSDSQTNTGTVKIRVQ